MGFDWTEEEFKEMVKNGHIKVKSEIGPSTKPHNRSTIKTDEQKIHNASEKGGGNKTSKYRNIKTEVNGINFDSQREARQFEVLSLLLSAGKIEDLRLQETFTLQRAYTTPQGERIKAVTYTSDFSYFNTPGTKKHIEDVKGKRTETFNVKWKWMQSMFPDYIYRLI